jgi:uncharacterized protein with ParB-like and HNH nuclease domain
VVKIKDERVAKTEAERQAAEQQLRELAKVVDYDTVEYPVEVIVEKYTKGREDDTNEIFVPDYQRDITWDRKRQAKFIESLLVGLPIPFLFVADVSDEDESKSGRLEIVDGSQRIRTLDLFLDDKLELQDLEKLTYLNGFYYSDLPASRQRRFRQTSLRMVKLTEKADEEARRDIFERINTGSDPLNDMEKRRGIRQGPFTDLIKRCSQDPLFHELAPLSDPAVKRFERDEFVLRFFAYLNNYKNFRREVRSFMDDYLDEMNKRLQNGEDPTSYENEWKSMLQFVKKHFKHGFSKGPQHRRTPRVRYEAIAVGVALALREKPTLVPSPTTWIADKKFLELITSDASNSKPRLESRIEFVRDRLLGRRAQ